MIPTCLLRFNGGRCGAVSQQILIAALLRRKPRVKFIINSFCPKHANAIWQKCIHATHPSRIWANGLGVKMHHLHHGVNPSIGAACSVYANFVFCNIFNCFLNEILHATCVSLTLPAAIWRTIVLHR